MVVPSEPPEVQRIRKTVKENHPKSSKLYNNDSQAATTIYIVLAESERNLTIEIHT